MGDCTDRLLLLPTLELLEAVLVFNWGLGPPFELDEPGVLAGGGGIVAVDAMLSRLCSVLE